MKYGKNNQVDIKTIEDFYFILGYLTQKDKTKIVWEHNEEQGAWGSEGRILFFENNLPFQIISCFRLTKGVGNITYRLNCNDFVNELINKYGFQIGKNQDVNKIKVNIPNEFIKNFEEGYQWKD
jgi:hypothetical protein